MADMKPGGDDHISAIPLALQIISVPGMMLLLWTVVMCLAFFSGSEPIIASHWGKLFGTWWVLAALWVAWTAGLALAARARQEAEAAKAAAQLPPRLVERGSNAPAEDVAGVDLGGAS